MIIDDEQLALDCLNRILRVEYRVVLTTSPTVAVAQMMGGRRFDVILCDMMMPRLSGMDVHSTLARYCPSQAARMVFVTGGATRPDEAAFLQRVSLPRLDKPFTVDGVHEVVRGVLIAAETDRPERAASVQDR